MSLIIFVKPTETIFLNSGKIELSHKKIIISSNGNVMTFINQNSLMTDDHFTLCYLKLLDTLIDEEKKYFNFYQYANITLNKSLYSIYSDIVLLSTKYGREVGDYKDKLKKLNRKT